MCKRPHVFLNKQMWRKVFRIVRREAVWILALLCYLLNVFAVLYPHPQIHLLAVNALFAVIWLVIGHQAEYLWRIWHARPTDPTPTFRWRLLAQELLVGLSPLLILALILWLSHYPW